MTGPASLSVVVPVYNSAVMLPALMQRLTAVLEEQRPYEVVLVNDGSADSSWHTITELCRANRHVRGINLMRNYGQHSATLAGVRAARNDLIVTIDDDLQNPPEEIPKLLAKLDEGYDVVYGHPIEGNRGLWRDAVTWLTKLALRAAIGSDIAMKASGFRAFRAELRQGFASFQGPNPNLDVLLSWSTSRYAATPVHHHARAEGHSGYTVGSLITHAFNVLTGFSTRPLRAATLVGIATMVFGVAVLAYVTGLLHRAGRRRARLPVPRLHHRDLRRRPASQPGHDRRVSGAYAYEDHGPADVRDPRRDRSAGRAPGTTRTRRMHGVARPEGAGATPGRMTYRIPFNRATLVGRELELLREAIQSGHLSGDGQFARRCELLLEEALGADRVLLTSSCTHALELAALLLDIEPGDEVIVPSFTFVSTAAAFALRGAKIVFADIRPDTLNIDERALPDLVGDRTRAIVPVHYAGVGCEMEPILEVARKHDLAIVEDNAHGLHGSYRGQRLGTFGVLAAQSFHETKNFTCGEGGALLINDPALVDRAEIITGERDEPEGVLPRRGRQVHVGRSRLELPALRASSRLPLGSAGGARRGRTGTTAALVDLPRSASQVGRGDRNDASRSSRTTATSRTTCSTSCCRRSKSGRALIEHLKTKGHPGRLSLRAAAPFADGCAVRRQTRASVPSRRTSATGCSDCRSTRA